MLAPKPTYAKWFTRDSSHSILQGKFQPGYKWQFQLLFLLMHFLLATSAASKPRPISEENQSKHPEMARPNDQQNWDRWWPTLPAGNVTAQAIEGQQFLGSGRTSKESVWCGMWQWPVDSLGRIQYTRHVIWHQETHTLGLPPVKIKDIAIFNLASSPH